MDTDRTGCSVVVVAVMLVLVAVCPSRGEVQLYRNKHKHIERHHLPQPKSPDGERKSLFKDDLLFQDKIHIKEDLRGVMSPEYINNMTQKELEYQYFQSHDFDTNNKLDGLELMAALGHVFQHGDHNHEGAVLQDKDYDDEEEVEEEGLSQDQLKIVVELIDGVLEEGDRNKDGYLNYNEYRLSREIYQLTPEW